MGQEHAGPGEPRIHPTARIEEGVRIGRGTSVWDHVHVRHGTTIGEQCIIGEKSYIAYDVSIGDRVKVNSFVYICAAVAIETGVMISASTTFTNDRLPRATTPDLARLRPSEADEHTKPTRVREGATIGAGCTIGSDLTIGRFAMVGMGSVVTRSVPDFHLALGNPARSVGFVCRCGEVVARFPAEPASESGSSAQGLPSRVTESFTCPACGLPYRLDGRQVAELAPPSR